ncbi:MAG: CAP domain-containing protein [Chloroflexi bacterium]|nr:CAP domain-containing protein [Chloroflexota bacterium]
MPVINSFTTNPPSISAGGSSTLSWNVTGVTSVTISPGGGSLPASGSATASPAATTTYILTATNAAGTITQSVTVTVAAAPPPPPADAATCEQALFNAVNAVRASNGKAALTRNAYIDGLCRQHAQYMATGNTLSHENFNTRFNAIVANISGMHACAENVLQNNLPCNANDMAQQWFASPVHNANMLNPAYNISGMGIVIDGGGKIWACQIFAGP